MLVLLACPGFHLPTATCVTASSYTPVCRTRLLVVSEEAAKAAWLAKNAQAWAGRVVSTAPLPDTMSTVPVPEALRPGSPILTLEAADEMTNVALREASSRSFNPVSVCVMDASGRTLVSKTMIGSSGLASEFARAKASTCIGMHCSSRELRDMYVNSEGGGPKVPQVLAMGTAAAAANQPMAPFPGGVLCRDATQNVVCAIGVSGARSDEDEHCAITAAKAVGLLTEPASSQLV